jgi:hypothetical protein
VRRWISLAMSRKYENKTVAVWATEVRFHVKVGVAFAGVIAFTDEFSLAMKLSLAMPAVHGFSPIRNIFLPATRASSISS